MKKLILLIAAVLFLFTGCATIAHKDISTTWAGFGVNLKYESHNTIKPGQIPMFIDAVNRLEKLLQERCHD